MRNISWNAGWQLSNGGPRRPFDDTPIPVVTLPHDAMISTTPYPEAPAGRSSGYYGGGVAVYTKYFDVPEEWKGQQIKLAFDGAYENAKIMVNGHVSTIHHYGYSPFTADLTPYLYYHRQNRVEITVNNTAQPNCRWYTGTGLYRPVSLLVGPAVHIAPWGIFAYTQRVQDGTAFVMVDVTVANTTGVTVDERVTVNLAPEGGESIVTNSLMLRVPPLDTAVVHVPLVVPNAPIWDLDDTRMCTVTAAVAGDESSTSFGIHTLTVDPVYGMQINGRTVKLKGGCIHADNGPLGATTFADAEYRKMKLHKDNGYNAIRTAHNPPSTALLDACDRLGLLVLDEAFDTWRMAKTRNDYHLFFEADWQKDMTAIITRDRNHPCVVLWSTGNEVDERGGLSDGYSTAPMLANFIRQLDPTRPVTNGLCSFYSALDDEKREIQMKTVKARADGTLQNVNTDFDREAWADLTESFADPLDVVGYNYFAERYEMDHARYPQRIICGTESWPSDIDRIWEKVERMPYVLGDFTWTSYDYLGEAGIGVGRFIEPGTDMRELMMKSRSKMCRTAYCSDFDICGFDRPVLHYRKIVWGSDETYIFAHDPFGNGKQEQISAWGWPQGDSSWSWAGYEGEPIRVDVYSAAEEVELSLNGVVVGRAAAGQAERFTARFEVSYAPGTLTAVSYTNGMEVSRHVVSTVGAATGLKISFEPGCFVAGEQSLAFAAVEVVDENGNRIPNAVVKANATVTGAATLQAFAAAKPDTMENYTTGEFTSFQGRWLAVLRSGVEAGTATLRVEADGFAPVEAVIPVK